MKLLVIDGNSIVNRAFYGIKVLTTKNGQFTNAIYGFMNILNHLLTAEKPDGVAVAFDLRAPTFRHKMYDGYKAQRKGMPEELAQQMPILKELLTDLGFYIVEKEGFEADDILGTLSAWASENGDTCVLATGDRDSFQLINNNVTVLLAGSKMGKSETTVMDDIAVFEKYGVTPKQMIEVKALMGDTSDNIPGVAGVGEKTALGLIQHFKTLDGVYENIDNDFIKKGAREKLVNDKETAYLSRKLAEICLDAPIDKNWDLFFRKSADRQKAKNTFATLEMYSMIEKYSLNDAENGEITFFDEPKEDLPQKCVNLLEKSDFKKVYIYVEDNAFIVVENDGVYTANADNKALLELLKNNECEIFAFDAKPIYRLALSTGFTAKNIVFDGKLAAYLLNPSASEYSLVRLAGEYGIKKEYNCDSEAAPYVISLFETLQKNCETSEVDGLLKDIELPLCGVLAQMEHTGVAVDKEGIKNFGEAVHLTLENELTEIYSLVGYKFNVNSPKQLGEALFVKLGLPTRKKNKSGYSTNAETLESLRDLHPAVDHILNYRIYQKLYSTYIEGLLKEVAEDGRIHTTFSQTEARTGRISSGEPNLQNIPVRTKLGSRLRQYFVAQSGNILLDADYSQIELRILAHISDDETMKTAFLEGKDIHQSTAAKIYGVPENMITPQLRSSAKAVNFGIVYGIGAFSLSKDIGVSVKEADAFIKSYLDNFSGVREYMDKTVQFAKDNGYVKTLFNRRRALPEIQSSNFNVRSLGERMAMNTPIQGTAADIIKIAMIRVSKRLEDENLKAKLVLQVHDELIVEAPENEKEVAAKILGEEMQNAAKLAVPLRADVNTGLNWLEAKG